MPGAHELVQQQAEEKGIVLTTKSEVVSTNEKGKRSPQTALSSASPALASSGPRDTLQTTATSRTAAPTSAWPIASTRRAT